jgi:outer membrane protein assembly factor BamB
LGHLFAFSPTTGKLHWHRDLPSDLKLAFFPDFSGGGSHLATVTKTDTILVISFENRVIALKLDEMTYLWHLQPDAFPHCPFPLAHGGKVFLSSGAKRKITILQVPPHKMKD